MSKKVLLADTNIGALGLVLAGTVVDTGEQRYTLLNNSKAPFADYDSSMDEVIAAYQNQAKILPDGRSHIDLADALAAAGLYTPPAVAEDIDTLQTDVSDLQDQQATDETDIALRALRLSVTAVKVAGYTAQADEFVPVDTTGGDITIALATAVGKSGHQVVIKLKAGSAGNDITVDPNGAQTIDGQATATIAGDATGDATVMRLISDGANWYRW